MNKLEEIINSGSNLTITCTTTMRFEMLCDLAKLARAKDVMLTLNVSHLSEELIDVAKCGGNNVTIVV